MVEAKDVVEKWKRRMKAATDDMRKGAQAVTVAPSKKAIEKKEKMRANVLEAIDTGRWERQLEKVSLEQWQKSYIEKAIGRIAAGVEGATDKMEDFMTKLLSEVERIKRIVDAMPDTTFEERMERMRKWAEEMHKFKYK